MSTTPQPGVEPPQPILGNRYRLGALLGTGGMGVVYAAQDLLLRRRVAVKVLPPEIQSDAAARERLRAEALAAAALDHPFICKVHEIGESDQRLFLVMEYVDGETLHALAAKGVLAPRQIVEIATEVAEALDEAHRHNVIHRDLKPSNIMLTAQGHVKVMDFGLAKQLDAPHPADGIGAAALTEPGVRVGTTPYMSPEQVLGNPLDPRSDIFSFGVILHELATGTHPFARDDPSDTIAAILCDPPALGPRAVDCVPGLGTIVGSMLAKACAKRPQSLSQLRVDLEALRDQARGSGSSSGEGAVADAFVERTPFTGRDTERAELVRSLESMLTGRGGCVLLGGEPGVGKTRLARELMKVARQRGCLCLAGHCYEMEGTPPFAPFVEIVEELVRLIPVALRATLGDAAPEIASIVPSLRRSYPDIPPLPEMAAEERRRLAFAAFAGYVRRGMQKSPAVLLLDDLHWADEPTLQLLIYLAPQLASMRLLIVGTYRDVELDVKRPFAKTLETLLRQRAATRIAVRRLDESAVGKMLAWLGGSAPPSELARAVYRETDGNPFFVEEVYAHLKEEGKLFDEPGRWKPELRAGGIAVPEGVRLVVGRRLERLGERPRKILTAAAVIGRTFSIEVLAKAVDASEDEVLDALDEAERAQLIAIEPARRTVRYGFVHELIRTTLTGGLSLPRRQRLHLRVADALEASSVAADERGTTMLAHHLYQAGAVADVQRTAAAISAALNAATAAAAFEETIELAENLLALELSESDARTISALEQKGTALAGLERPEQAVAAWERAVAAHAARGDDARVTGCADAAAQNLVWLGRMADASAIARLGLRCLSEHATRERAALQGALARAMNAEGYINEAGEHFDQAIVAAEAEKDADLLRRALASKAANETFSNEYAASLNTAQRVLALLRDDDLWLRADILTRVGMNHWHLGNLVEAERVFVEAEPVARRARHYGAMWNGRGILSQIKFSRDGDLRGFLARAEPELRGTRFAYVMKWEIGLVRLLLGEVEQAITDLGEARSLQPSKHWLSGMAEGGTLFASVLTGRERPSRSELIQTVEHLLPHERQRNTQGAFGALTGLVLALGLMRERARCASLYPLTRLFIATGCYTLGSSTLAEPHLLAGIAAEAADLPEQATEHFEVALERANRVPRRLLQPITLFWHGRSLLGRGPADRERGRAMLAAALEDFQTLGVVPYARHSEELLRGSPPPLSS